MSTKQSPPFRYVLSTPEARPHDGFVAVVPCGLRGTGQLMKALAAALQLPDYFGHNWNALADCLRDLHWLSEHTVYLIHEALPELPPADLAEYLSVLAEAVRDWQPGEAHALVVIFPPACRCAD